LIQSRNPESKVWSKATTSHSQIGFWYPETDTMVKMAKIMKLNKGGNLISLALKGIPMILCMTTNPISNAIICPTTHTAGRIFFQSANDWSIYTLNQRWQLYGYEVSSPHQN
jgi:hypothetical protein